MRAVALSAAWLCIELIMAPRIPARTDRARALIMEPRVIAPVFVRVIAPEFMRVVDPPLTRVVVPPFMRVLRELPLVNESPPWRVLEVVLVPQVAPDIVLTPLEVVVDVRVVELVVPFRAAVTACSAPLSVALV